MVAIAPGDVLSVDNPLLEAFCADGGFLADPLSLEFQIFNATADDAAPTQVFPATVGARQSVNLTTDKLAVGHFVAAWSAPGNLTAGRYEIRWFLVQKAGAREHSWRRAFDVLPYVPSGELDAYALVADVRAEGVGSDVKNSRIVEALVRQAEMIRGWTGRDFTPRYKALKFDGIAALVLPINEPICAVESVRFDADETPIGRDSYRVYARHLTQGLVTEDDRDAPRIEFTRVPYTLPFGSTYPLVSSYSDLGSSRVSAAQELVITGVFGYTEPEPRGSPVGVTPAAIRRVNVLLALRDLPKAASQAAAAQDVQNGGKIKRQKTREQEIEWDTSGQGEMSTGSYAPFTGDPEIDRILLQYTLPLTGTGL